MEPAHTSSGYTRAFASTAPVAPAVALPQAPIGAALDWIAILVVSREKVEA